ncbi:MAG: thioredoxin family protein [Flavobacteriales bacterium]
MFFNDILKESHTYVAYRKIISNLISCDKTTGLVQTEDLLKATKQNVERMNKIDLSLHISKSQKEEIKHLKRKIICLVIAEAWSYDCAELLPIIQKVSDASEGTIDIKIVFRDEYPALIAAFDTNGTHSIPKVIAIDAQSMQVLCLWGPRPRFIQDMVLKWKKEQVKVDWSTLQENLLLSYQSDNGKNILEELIGLVNSISIIKIKNAKKAWLSPTIVFDPDDTLSNTIEFVE